MSSHTVEVPQQLVSTISIDFVKEILKLPPSDEYIFDFKQLNRIDPFSLLFVSSEIKRCREKNSNSKFNAINFENCHYQAHMGFFQAFGLPYGKKPGEATGSNTYLPITVYKREEIICQAISESLHPGEILEHEARRICNVLSLSDNGILFEVLVYCIREIFRNVIEHSESDQFSFCAQYRPSMNRVSFAIIDHGIGIRKSLELNPKLKIIDDSDAILTALKPAISGKVYSGQKNKPKGDWANSGYGLYMTSNICKKGGNFFIASGNSGIFLTENKIKTFDIPFEGTALNLSFDTTRLGSLREMLKNLRDQESIGNPLPSKSSLGLILD